MNQDMSIFSLVLHASLVVQLVMAGLLIVSLVSWTVIFGKLFGLARTRHHFVAALQQLAQYGSADKSGSANQCNLHGRILYQQSLFKSL